MRIAHDMPFGAQPQAGGGTRFRLWAPSARRVDLCVESAEGERLVAMQAQADGWHARLLDLEAGTRYRYRIDEDVRVPDPASRFNPDDVAGPSVVVDPRDFDWPDDGWRGRPWHEAAIYELHVGTFTPEGTYTAALRKLDHLVDLGVTAIELMPIAEFPGRHNWGYDGVLLFAPDSRYGAPDDLKRFVCAAHAKGLMVLLDVVYNHFGPQGNYLHRYATPFFTERHHTPWGAAINFDDTGSRTVRDFYLHNALYWLEEYRFDGLRFDAVHAIRDDGTPNIVNAIAQQIHDTIGAHRHVHLILENEHNGAHLLARASGDTDRHDAQWNDDVHHCLHALITGEQDGYYVDYAPPAADTRQLLARALVEGFAYQGEASTLREGAPRGEPSGHLPPTCFIDFLQNHDQIGNRALGERIGHLAAPEALRAGVAVILLSPHVPMLFMGEEWNAPQPFLFFCDFDPELANLVREGRRGEFSRFEQFREEAARLEIPDPSAADTFARSRLDWNLLSDPAHRQWLDLYRHLLRLRAQAIAPRLPGTRGLGNSVGDAGDLYAAWRLGDGTRLHLCANLQARSITPAHRSPGRILYGTHAQSGATPPGSELAPWSVTWSLEDAGA